jgi:hypothetical protein
VYLRVVLSLDSVLAGHVELLEVANNGCSEGVKCEESRLEWKVAPQCGTFQVEV